MVDSYIRKACDAIMDSYSERVSLDFDSNKELVSEIADMKSKKLRNRIAGRLVVYKRNEDRVIIPPRVGRFQRRKGERKTKWK